jgi:hypothetical protein
LAKLRKPCPTRLTFLMSRLTASVGPLQQPPVACQARISASPGPDRVGKARQFGYTDAIRPAVEATYLLVRLDKEYTERRPKRRWEDYYAGELLAHFGAG